MKTRCSATVVFLEDETAGGDPSNPESRIIGPYKNAETLENAINALVPEAENRGCYMLVTRFEHTGELNPIDGPVSIPEFDFEENYDGLDDGDFDEV